MSKLNAPFNNTQRDEALVDHDSRLEVLESAILAIQNHPALSVPALVDALQSVESPKQE
jgi:hypothetical protein